MPLFSIDDEEQNHIPHKPTYDLWMANLSENDFSKILEALHDVMDNTPPDNQVITSSYIPGSDWSGSPYEPIYHACREDWEAARLFFGQLVWRAVQLHPERWYFIRQERDDDRPIGLTYFRGRR